MRLRELLRQSTGNVAVELAMAAPIMLALMAGLVDYGRVVIADARLKSAIRAGLEFVQSNPGNISAVQDVVRIAASDPALSVTTATVCECTSGAAAACGSTCADGTGVGSYVAITAQQSFLPYFPAMNAVIESPLRAQGSIRVK